MAALSANYGVTITSSARAIPKPVSRSAGRGGVPLSLRRAPGARPCAVRCTASGSHTDSLAQGGQLQREQELAGLSVEKGLKPLLRLYGLPVSGKKQDLVARLMKHEQGGPNGAASPPPVGGLEPGQAASIMAGYDSWRRARGQSPSHDSLAGVKIDVEGMVSALGSMLLEDLDPQHPEHSKAMQWRQGLYDISERDMVRLQIEALARCLEEMYTVLPGTLYAQQDARTRDVRVDIDLHAGSILVAFQRLRGDGSVAEEVDDTAAALAGLESAQLSSGAAEHGARGGRRRGGGGGALSALKEVYEKHLVALRREYDASEEERMVEQHFADSENTLVRGTVVAWGASTRAGHRDALLQVMPGYVRAGLPTSLQVPMEQLRLGQELPVIVHQVLKGAAIHGKAPLVVSRASTTLPVKLLESMVDEMKLGAVSVTNVAREPGVGCKIAVRGSNPKMNAVGLCLGRGNWRVSKLQAELGGETVSLVENDGTPNAFVANALFPAVVSPDQVVLDLDQNQAIVHLDPLKSTRAKVNFAKAIGRGGCNVKLASKLTGWNIMIDDQGLESQD